MKISLFHGSEQYAVFEHAGDYGRFAVRVSGWSGLLRIRFSVPVLDVHGCWAPESRTPSAKLPWTVESRSAGQRAFPFLAFFNSAQVNRLSAGLTNLADDTKILAQMNQESCAYDITFEVALGKDSGDFELILDQRPLLWTDCLADWRKTLGVKLPAFPDAAWEPVYCTWYAVHAAVTQDWVEENARIAASLGFRTLIIDDGWCFDAMKRVSPETISTWYEWIGDWRLSKRKFPDFENHRKRVQAMGMKYLFWVAPFLIGVKSGLIKMIPGCFSEECREGCHVFDSRRRDAADILLDKMKHVMADYGLDGLKVDFLDHIFPDTEDPRGRDTMRFVRKLAESVRAVKPDALLEFRQAYATPVMLPYATQFRAGDVPFDFLDNFLRILQIRVSMGDGVPVHADPAFWHPRESPVNIARHMIASLAGVPMLSMDLSRTGEMEKRIIRHWLGFYREHRKTLNFGKWDISFLPGGAAYAMACDDAESIVILLDSAHLGEALRKAAPRVFILNLSAEAPALPGGKTWSGEGNRAPEGRIPPGGLGELER